MKVTDCTCTEPGWCERHQCRKLALAFQYCQRLPAYFEAWERGELRELCLPSTQQSERAAACRHLGPELRQVACETCRGSVRLKVFACSLHGECVLGRAPKGLSTCVLCEQYDPSSISRPNEQQTPE